MRNADVLRMQQRIADARTERRRELDADARPPVTRADRVGSVFNVGDRVLDLRGGLEGTVADVGVADRAGQVSLDIRFDDGSRGSRVAADLLARPRPPAARE